MGMFTRITTRIKSDLTAALDLETPLAPLDLQLAIELQSGTGAGKADMRFTDTRTIAASGSDALDLAGSLTGPLGGTLTFARVKAVYVKAAAGNTNDVQVTRPASNGVPLFMAAGDGIAIQPGGAFLWVAPTAAGVAVTAGTADLLTIVNSGAGTSVTYDVVIIGASA